MSYQACPSRSTSLSVPAGVVGGDGYERVMRNAAVVQQGGVAGIGGLGMTAAEIASLINTSAQSMLPLIVANNPGTRLETGPNGQLVIYHQPTGTTANLTGGFTQGVSSGQVNGAAGNIQTPIGSANFQGIKTEYLMIGAGILAVVLLSGRK